MQLVNKVDQIFANVGALESIRTNKRSDSAGDYLKLIKRGTCFLPYPANDGIAFAPSRFIGYVSNSFAEHATNDSRDGRLTNGAINAILGQSPVADPTLEAEYHRFCTHIGITPPRTGTFGVQRKYWITPDIRDRLEILAEDAVVRSPDLSATEREQIIKARIGQGVFRDALVTFWKGRCCVTGCAVGPVLRASHIKPWRASTNAERLDRYNGMLLAANIDVLFDRGLISFSDEGEILRSREISVEALMSLGCNQVIRVRLGQHHAPYLAYHRAVIFRSLR
ncbi:HNH endonuclease [Sinorhizobium meliloti]|nr:HNH endonuclease [Sinorhizobium meliloti]